MIDCCTREIPGWNLELRCRDDEPSTPSNMPSRPPNVRPAGPLNGVRSDGTDTSSSETLMACPFCDHRLSRQPPSGHATYTKERIPPVAPHLRSSPYPRGAQRRIRPAREQEADPSDHPRARDRWSAGTSACEAEPGSPRNDGRSGEPRLPPRRPEPTVDDRHHRTSHAHEGKVYCCVVLDAWSRKIVGWSIDRRPTAATVNAALGMAIEQRTPPQGALVHSDHGSQYTSWTFSQRVRSSGLAHSLGMVGDAFDNAMVESFWGRMQTELLNTRKWKTRVELSTAIFDWIGVLQPRPSTQRPRDDLPDRV